MLCTNCGKDIPYAGKVCPFCAAEKSGDKRMHVGAMISTGLAIVAFIIGISVSGFFAGLMAAVIVFFVGAACLKLAM